VKALEFIQAWMAQRFKRERWRFTWDAVILFAGNGFTSFLFLLFHMLAGRRMAGADYAEFVAMVGLLNVLSVPAGVMQLTMARYIAERDPLEADETWLLLVRRGLRGVTLWGLAALSLWCLISPALRMGLHASTVSNVVMVGVIAFVFLYTPILGGALQGSHRFGWFASSGLGVGASRLLLLLPVLWLGGSVAAVLGVVAVSFAVGLLISYWPIRRMKPTASPSALPNSREMVRYFFGVLIGQVALYALIQADLIVSTRLFSGDVLAAYGKAATLSRIVFFLPLPIIIAMFPRAVISKNPKILLFPLGATLGLTVAAATFFTLFPALPMKIMYGVSDPIHLGLVRRYVWAAIPMAMISILSPYVWARRAVRSSLWLVPVTGVYLLVLWRGQLTPEQLIRSMLVAGLVALAWLIHIAVGVFRADRAAARGGETP